MLWSLPKSQPIGHNTQRDFAVHSAAAPECDRQILRGKTGGTGTDNEAAAGARTPEAANQKHPVCPRVRRCVPSFGAGQSPCPTWGFQGGFGPISGKASGRGPRGRRGAGESPGAFVRPGSHIRPQCGRFRGFEVGAVSASRLWDWRCSCKKPPESPPLRDFRRR